MGSIEEKLTLLAKIAKTFEDKGIHYAIGASCMLYLRGIVDDFNDLDIMTTVKDSEKAAAILLEMGEEIRVISNKGFASRHFHRFVVDGIRVDLLGDFIIVNNGAQYDVSYKKLSSEYATVKGTRVIIDELPAWAMIYDLMGRYEKARIIREYLEKNFQKM